jgi:hypothetical protein
VLLSIRDLNLDLLLQQDEVLEDGPCPEKEALVLLDLGLAMVVVPVLSQVGTSDPEQVIFRLFEETLTLTPILILV